MLFRCNCHTFNIKRNSYRLQYNQYMTFYIKSILYKIEKKICILIFEGGGLYDEYNIIYNAIKKNVLFQKIDIYIIENLQMKTINKAQKYFIFMLKKHFIINNIIVTKTLILKEIEQKKYDALIVYSLDPFYFSIDQTFKSILHDINYFTKYQFICVSILYLKKDNIIWDIFLKNTHIYNKYLLHQELTGNKFFFYKIKQKRFYL